MTTLFSYDSLNNCLIGCVRTYYIAALTKGQGDPNSTIRLAT